MSSRPTLTLEVLPEPLTVCRLAPDAAIPAWATGAPFWSVTRTTDELSVICPASRVPPGVGARDDGWRALKLVGPFAFSEVGVLLRIAAPLAEAGVSILPVATYDTDYVLVRGAQLPAALGALRAAGHLVRTPDPTRRSDPA